MDLKLLSSNKNIDLRSEKEFHKGTIPGSVNIPILSNDEFENWEENNVDDYELIQKGSSIKFCEIAEGKADLYPRFGSTSEWDIAAGHIILVEAGGEINSIDDKKILYNHKESVINPHFIASCKIDK